MAPGSHFTAGLGPHSPTPNSPEAPHPSPWHQVSQPLLSIFCDLIENQGLHQCSQPQCVCYHPTSFSEVLHIWPSLMSPTPGPASGPGTASMMPPGIGRAQDTAGAPPDGTEEMVLESLPSPWHQGSWQCTGGNPTTFPKDEKQRGRHVADQSSHAFQIYSHLQVSNLP